MAYQSPYFVFLHALRAAGASFTTTPSAATDFDAFYLADGRTKSLFKFGSSGANSRIDVDRGAGTLEAVDTLVIPSGHNLGAQTVSVKASATGAFAGEETTLQTFTSAAGLIVQTITSSTARYLRVTFAGTGQWQLGELWIGRKRQPAYGPDPVWRENVQPNYMRVAFDSGVTGGVILGPGARVLGIQWVALDGTNLTIFRDLQSAVGSGGERFWMLPPSSDFGLTLFELSTPMAWTQDHPVPGNPTTGPTYTVALGLLEVLG